MALTDIDQHYLLRFISNNHLKIKPSFGWHNFGHTCRDNTVLVLDITDLTSLCSLLRKIYSINTFRYHQKIHYRVAAGGHGRRYSESHSVHGVYGADIIIRLVGEEFNKVHEINDAGVAVVGASMQIGEFHKELNKSGLSLATAPLTPYVSIAGLIAYTGNGTGRDGRGIAGYVRAMTIVLPNGEITRLDASHPNFHTLVPAHNGLLGVVINVEIECTKGAKLLREENVTSLAGFIKDIEQGLFTKNECVSALLFCMYEKDLTNKSLKNVRVYKWARVPDTTELKNQPNPFFNATHEVEARIYDSCRVASLFSRFPQLVAPYSRNVLAPIAVGARNHRSIEYSASSMHYLQSYLQVDLVDAGFLFNVSSDCHESDCHEIVEVLNEIYNLIIKYARQGKYPVTTSMYVRYFQGTNGGASPSAYEPGKHVCAIDIISSNSMKSVHEFLLELWTTLRDKYQAKPHPGKWLPPGYKIESPYFRRALNDWFASHGIPINNGLVTEHFLKLFDIDLIGVRNYSLFRPQHAADRGEREVVAPRARL